MKKIDLGQTIQIVANIGVIAGIIFLAFELRQNSELLASQARSNLVASRNAYQQYVATNAGGITDIIMKVRDSELTETERFRLDVHWSLLLNNWASMFQEVERGPLQASDLPLQTWRVTFSSNPDLAARWDVMKVEHSPKFIEFIETEILNKLASSGEPR